MKVWLINVGEEIPSDAGTPRLLRTGILAEQLVARGHDVTWWNSTVNHQRKEQRSERTLVEARTPQGYRLILLHGRRYDSNVSLARILSHVENAREFARLAPTLEPPDVVLCGMPTIELAAAATRFARARRIPIAIDLRDMWPEVIRDHASGVKRLLASPLIAHWERTQRRFLAEATAIVGITDAFVDWGVAKSGRPREPLDRAFHLAVNPSAPPTGNAADAEAFWDSHGITAERGFTVGSFVGRLSNRLDLGAMLQGALLLDDAEREKIRLVICGEGDIARELAALAGGAPHILFPGWRNAAELAVLLARTDFGLLPYLSTPDFAASFPNKVGEYLGAGLPIMTGLTGITGTMLAARSIQLPYQEGRPETVRDCLRRIIDGRGTPAHEQMRARARAAYDELFDARRIYAAFCDYLEALPGAQRARS